MGGDNAARKVADVGRVNKRIRSHIAALASLVEQDRPEGTVAEGLERWLAEIRRRAAMKPGTRDRLSPRTCEAYEYSATWIAEEIGSVTLAELTETMVMEALERVTEGSRHCVGTSVQAGLSWLGVPECMPDRRHWERRPESKEWQSADYGSAFAALLENYDKAKASGRLCSMVTSLCALLVAVLGLRVGEAVGLRMLDIRHGWLNVRGKTGQRKVPLSSAAKRIIDLSPASAPEHYVFPARQGAKNPHVLASSVSHLVRRVCDRVGLPHVHTHWLRHAYASWLRREGYDLLLISRLLGHTSTATTAKYYLHLEAGEQHRAAEAVSHELTRGQLTLDWGGVT